MKNASNKPLEKMEKETEQISMPVCPYCKTELTPFNYRGYYDSFMGWECQCDEIPNAEKSYGQYA
jgi:hypothetical protein